MSLNKDSHVIPGMEEFEDRYFSTDNNVNQALDKTPQQVFCHVLLRDKITPIPIKSKFPNQITNKQKVHNINLENTKLRPGYTKSCVTELKNRDLYFHTLMINRSAFHEPNGIMWEQKQTVTMITTKENYRQFYAFVFT